MKLCIVKPDATSAEILLSLKHPTLESINDEILFFENYSYKIVMRDEQVNEDTEIFVGDYALKLHYNASKDEYETDNERIFDGCFDLAYITVVLEDEQENIQTYYSDFFRVATTKQTAKQVEQMLEEIENSIPNFLDVCFSRSNKRAGLVDNDVRSVWNTFKLLDEIVQIFEENYSCFSNHKKTSVEPVQAIVDIKEMRIVDDDSLRWIVCNPDLLLQTDKDSGIEYRDNKYMPQKIKTSISKYSYDVYENKVILGFLRNVIEHIRAQIDGFKREMSDVESIPEQIIMQLPNTHELTGRCIYVYYKGVVQRYESYQILIEDLFNRYQKVLGCSIEDVYGIPVLTNTFKRVHHYRICYECIRRWFESGDYSFDHLNYLFKLKTLSRIFEYYCLIKMQTALKLCGYSFVGADRIEYDIEDDLEDINNQYIFVGNGYEITLFYEPSVWGNRINQEMNLYSTGYNFTKGKWNNKWTPDFVLKIYTGEKEYYYILDSKYSNFQNVKKRYIPELVLKYSTQIASKDKFFSDVIGVGAIYPSDEDKFYSFKKNGVKSNKMSLPSYFSMTILGEDNGNDVLKDRMDKLLNVAKILDEENDMSTYVASEFYGEIKQDEEEISRVDQAANLVKKNVELVEQDKKQEKIEEIALSTDEMQQNSLDTKINVNGRKCYYYGKNMCMCQRKICGIVNAPCDLFVAKASKALLENETSCRNFIQYMKKGKLKRVECSISGLPGCIGQDNCKFCLKKKNS